MERRVTKRSARITDVLLLYLCLMAAATSSFPRSADARKSEFLSASPNLIKNLSKKVEMVNHKEPRAIISKHLEITNSVNSPIVPLVDDINEHDDDNVDSTSSTIPLSEIAETPPFCEYPPSTPNSPTPTSSLPPVITNNPSPGSPIEGGGGTYTPSVPPFSSGTPPTLSPPLTNLPNLTPPSVLSSPPPTTNNNIPNTPSSPGYIPNTPSSPGYIPNPPIIYFDPPSSSTANPPPNSFLNPPSVPNYNPSPPSFVITPPSPSTVPNYGVTPTPPVFQPPVVYPPPLGPPPRNNGPSMGALWCVAKPSVPDPIIEEAMNYACGSGADCDSLQPNQPCFQPDTLYAHASYAFNSYWQRTKVAGGTCEFGGTAILVTVDPSYDGCHFIYY